MIELNIFKLWRRWKRFGAINPAKMSRVDYLLWLGHDLLEEPNRQFGGLNFLQIVEKHVEEGKFSLARGNFARQVRTCFRLANLYWGQGNIVIAEKYLRKALERHRRLIEVCSDNNFPLENYREYHLVKCAACLLGEGIPNYPLIGDMKPGYEDAFLDMLMTHCLEPTDFDMNLWQANLDLWTKRGFPKYRIEEFGFYVKALTGEFVTTDAMFTEHQRLIKGRGQRNPDASLLDGYNEFNELVIDFIFAAILKRIGWKGLYRHSWPQTDIYGAPHETIRPPDGYLNMVALMMPDPDTETGVIADKQLARRFIDIHLANQKDYEGKFFDPKRIKSERGKVAGRLKTLDWGRDTVTLDLMRAYDMENVLNDQTNIVLADPFGSDIDLKGWTDFLHTKCGLPTDFIGIAGDIESGYSDLGGAWYMYRKKDKKVYLLDRDDWAAPEAAIHAAREGLNVWPSYTSFVAWWVSEHLTQPS